MQFSRRNLIQGGMLVLGGATSALLFSCSKDSNDQSSGRFQGKFTVGHLVALDMAPFFLAHSLGYFGEKGLDVEPRFFANPGDNNAALAGGSLQLTINPFTLPYLGRAAGTDFGIVASCGGTGVMEIIAQRETGLKSLDDLAEAASESGPKVKIGTLRGDTLDVILYKSFVDRGVNYDGFEMVWFNDLLAMVEAFRTNQIDVLSHIKPYTTDLILSKGANSLGTNETVWGVGTPNTVLMGLNSFIDRYTDDVIYFVNAFRKGYEFALNSPAEAADVLVEGNFYPVGKDALLQAIGELYPEYIREPNMDGVGQAIGDLVQLGYMQPVDLNIVRNDIFA